MVCNRIDKISFDDTNMYLRVNGRGFAVPMNAISLRLVRLPESQRSKVRISDSGHSIRWPTLDLEMQISSLLSLGKPYWRGI